MNVCLFQNVLQDSYRNYVTTLRPLVEMLTSLQEKAFNEENTKTMFKQIKSVLQKLKDPHINLYTQASLIDTITLEDVQGIPDSEPTTSNVTKSKTNELATLSTIINKIEEITGKLSFPQVKVLFVIMYIMLIYNCSVLRKMNE